MIALLSPAAHWRGWFAGVPATFGRVPMFYYLLHIPAIHLAALLVTFLREGSFHPEWYASAPYTSVPPGHRWGLPLLYLGVRYRCRCLVPALPMVRSWQSSTKELAPLFLETLRSVSKATVRGSLAVNARLKQRRVGWGSNPATYRVGLATMRR